MHYALADVLLTQRVLFSFIQKIYLMFVEITLRKTSIFVDVRGPMQMPIFFFARKIRQTGNPAELT